MGAANRAYAPSGHLIYVRAGTLMAAPLSLSPAGVTGAPVAVQDGLPSSGRSPCPVHIFQSQGSLIYQTEWQCRCYQPRRLVWVDRKAVPQTLAAPPRRYQFPRLSPNGRSIALQVVADKTDIWIYDLTRGNFTPNPAHVGRKQQVGSSGRRMGARHIHVESGRSQENLFWKLADGSGPEERLTSSEHVQAGSVLGPPDGQRLVFGRTPITITNDDIWVLPLRRNRKPWPFLRTPFPEGWARLSWTAAWLLAYVSKELARTEGICSTVSQWRREMARFRLSAPLREPVWSHDGRELFYRSGNKMMAVDITSHPTFPPGSPGYCSSQRCTTRISTTPDYDVSLDGQRFLMIQAAAQQSAAPYNVVLNWFDELNRRAARETVMPLWRRSALADAEIMELSSRQNDDKVQ